MKEKIKRENLGLRDVMGLIGLLAGGLDVLTTGLPLVTTIVPGSFEVGRRYVAKRCGSEKPKICEQLGNFAYSAVFAVVPFGIRYYSEISEFVNNLG